MGVQRSVLGCVGLAAAVAIWGHSAAAEPAALQIAAFDAQSCVSEPEVRAALEQAGLVLGSPSPSPSPSPADAEAASTQIQIQGTPEHLSIVLRTAERVVSTSLPPATCATATDVVAAFLVSALAPVPLAPPLPAPPPGPPPLQAETLLEAVRAELARRGTQLVLERVRLSIERDGSGTWFARISGADQPSVTRTIVLGNFDELSAPRIATVTDGIALAVREVSALQRAPAVPPPSELALRHALDRVERDSSVSTWLGVGEVALGSSLLLLLLGGTAQPNAHLGFDTGGDAFMTASASVAVLGGSASFFVPDDYRRAVIGVSGLAAFGAFSTGLTLYGEHSVPTYSTAALAAGSYSSAALLGLNAIIRTPQISRLRAARRRLREPGASSDEVRSRVEADLAQSEPPLSPLLSYFPLIAGGVVAMLPSFADGFSNDERVVVAAGGAISCAIGLSGALLPSNYSRYQRELRELGVSDISFGVLPGARYGISLSGRF